MKLSSPDVNVFIHASLHQKYPKKYFEELKNSRIQKGLLLESVTRVFDYWLVHLPSAVMAFFSYCKKRGLKPKVYLEHVKSGDRDRWMKRYSRYSNVIENMIKRKIDDTRIQEIRKELKESFYAKVQIFTRPPHLIISNSIDESYKETIFNDLKRLTNNRFKDKEDSGQLALLIHYINQAGISNTVLFLTEDSVLRTNFSKDIYDWSGQLIGIICCKEFFEGIPQFMKSS